MTNKKTTNEIYDELHENLLYPSLFYVSDNFIDKFSENEEFKTLKELKHIIFAFEDKTYNFIVQKASNISFLLSKSQKLSSNVFALADYQAILSESQFNILLKKYKRQLDAYVEISEIMNHGIDEKSKPIFQTTKGHFMMQEMNFKEHQNIINQSFPILQRITKPKIKRDAILNKSILKDSNAINFIKEKTLFKNKSATKKEKIVIDAVAIQDYLIATVFTDKNKAKK